MLPYMQHVKSYKVQIYEKICTEAKFSIKFFDLRYDGACYIFRSSVSVSL